MATTGFPCGGVYPARRAHNCFSGFPSVQELIHRRWIHGAHLLELTIALGIKKLSLGIEDSKRWNAFGEGHIILRGKIEVLVQPPVLPCIDVNDYEV